MHNLTFFNKLNTLAQQQVVITATVVATQGASPRGVGAKMVFLSDGTCYGTIGGGCVEGTVKSTVNDMFQSARMSQVIKVSLLGTPGVLHEDVCGGKMWVLLEKITPAQIQANNQRLTLVIMAAGIGSRYGGTKQIEAIGPTGEILLDYSIADAVFAGFNHIVLIIRPDLQTQFEPYIRKWTYNYPVQVSVVYQEIHQLPEGFQLPSTRTKPWGTSHAVLCARSVVQNPFAVINADDYYGQQTYQAMAEFLRCTDCDSSNYAMIGFSLRNTFSDNGPVSRGVCYVNSQGYLERIIEQTKLENRNGDIYAHQVHQPDLSLDMPVSMNFWGFTPTIFQWIEQGFSQFLQSQTDPSKGEYYIPLTIDQCLKNKQITVKVLPTSEQWIGITYKEDLATVQKKLFSLKLLE